jgi:CRP-like cAMP-binding protein
MTQQESRFRFLAVSRWSVRGKDAELRCVRCPARSQSIFCDLDSERLPEWAPLLQVRSYPRAAVLFVENDEPQSVYCVRSGRVKLSSVSSEGRGIIAALAGPGSLLGARAALLGRPHDLTAVIVEPTQLCTIPRDGFLEMLERNTEVSLQLARQMGDELGEAYRKISGVACKPLAERLAELLLALCQTHGEPTPRGIHLRTNLCQEEMSELLGVSRRSLNRALAELKELGLIECRRRSILVPSSHSLYDWLALGG